MHGMTSCFGLSIVLGLKVEGAITMSLRMVNFKLKFRQFYQLFCDAFYLFWLKYVPYGAIINDFYLYYNIVGLCGCSSFVPVPYTVFF